MADFNRYTTVRIALPFCAGIILGLSLAVSISASILIGVFSISYCVYLISQKLAGGEFSLRWVPGISAQLSLLAAGFSLLALLQKNDNERDVLVEQFSGQALICRIDEKPVPRAASFLCKATTLAFIDSLNEYHPARVTFLLYFKDDSTCLSVLPGDIIVLKAGLQKIKGPLNPGSFDYKRYLFFNRIRWQAFTNADLWFQIKRDKVGGFKRWSYLCKSRFQEALRRFNIEGNDLGLASGLLLGDKQLLDDDTVMEFQNAGAMHVMSVSGLHVGIMYVLADRLLFFLKRGRYGKKLQQFIILLLIWGYAILTGLPPSVIRASLMFSLIAIASMSSRSHEGFNILAGAAFLQLWISPYSVMHVGFQLSYFAVLGIFMFYKPINSLFSGSNRVLSWVWSVVSVSLAAQLGTFPLAGYYFHFFPVYFLVTNLVVVPIAGIVVYLSLFVFTAGWMGISLAWLGLPLKWSLQFMQRSVDLIQSWPGSVIHHIDLTGLQVLLIMLAIFGLYSWMVEQNRKGPLVVTGAVTMVFLMSGLNRIVLAHHASIVVYHIPGHTALEGIYKAGSMFICDSSLLADPGKISFNVQPNRDQMKVKQVCNLPLGKELKNFAEDRTWIKYPFVHFMDKRIVFIDGNWKSIHPHSGIPVDLAIFIGRRVPSLTEVIKVLDISQCIIDSSVPRYRADKLYDEAVELGLPCHSTSQDGGYVLKW